MQRKPSKYKNIRTQVNGHCFDSLKEANRYQELLLLEKAGEIKSLRLQPSIPLWAEGKPITYDSGRVAAYRADFEYFDVSRGTWTLEDVKGARTQLYKLKKAILKNMGIEVVET